MKIFFRILILLVCIGALCLPVTAESVRSADSTVVVAADGSCDVSLHFQIRLDEAKSLRFPLPRDAQNVRINGQSGKVSVSGQQLMASLGQLGAGVHTVDIRFSVANAITQEGSVLRLQVPLLTGLSLPVEDFSFRITLPGELDQTPSLTSNWGQDVTSKIRLECVGRTISGTATDKLLDSTELSLVYKADPALFPDYSAEGSLLGGWQMVMVLLMAAGVGYYLLALMPSFPRRIRSFSPPEGLAAGDLATCLTGCGMDLTMMVFSWAELGYLTIQMDRRGRVHLQKRMDMGSERSEFENRCFQKLFSGRQTVDGMGLHYALLCRKMAKKSPLLRQIYKSRSGNPKIVGALAIAAGACSGVVLSLNVYTGGAMTVLLVMAMAAMCAGLSYLIQSGSRCVPLGNRTPVWLWGLCSVVWIVTGVLCGSLPLALAMVAYESLTGLAAAVGGRRSEAGRQYLAEIRGLRAHLTRGSIFSMQQCLEKNPSYFFDLMPYALALGVEKRFARRFGKIKICECDYLLICDAEAMTPTQWAQVMRQVADCLNRRQRKLQYERMLQSIGRN